MGVGAHVCCNQKSTVNPQSLVHFVKRLTVEKWTRFCEHTVKIEQYSYSYCGRLPISCNAKFLDFLIVKNGEKKEQMYISHISTASTDSGFDV